MSPRGAGFLFGRDVVEVSTALSLRLMLIEVPSNLITRTT